MNNNLPKNNILRGKKEFNKIFSGGKYIKNKNITIIYLNADQFRIAFTVSKRIKGAVCRNRIKRRLREIYRTHKSYFPDNTHIILMGKSSECDFQTLRRDVLSAVAKINKQ